MKGKFLKEYLNKWKKMGTCVKPCIACEYSGQWASMHEKSSIIPCDVPKGHLVVYAGDNHKRFVIKIALLNHPLFKALLDQAKEEYGLLQIQNFVSPVMSIFFSASFSAPAL